MGQGKHAPPEVLLRLRDQLKSSGLKLQSLNSHYDGATDELRGICNGSRSPTLANVAAIAEAICVLVRENRSGEPKERLSAFWKDFRRTVLPAAASLPDDPKSSDLRPFLQQACGLGGRLSRSAPSLSSNANPFTWRSVIRNPAMFHGRENELRRLRDYLRNRQNVQVVGERRIGKSSLLAEASRRSSQWLDQPLVAWADLQSAACQTQTGWLRQIAKEWQLSTSPAGFAEFAEQVETLLKQRRFLVLLLDECEKFIPLAHEFPLDFFEGLRALGQVGLSLVTASAVTLREIREHGGPLSPYYNTFAVLPLERFTEAEAEAFVTRAWPGMNSFNAGEQVLLRSFGERHPLRLQLLAYHLWEARLEGVTPATALARAEQEWNEVKPSISPPMP